MMTRGTMTPRQLAFNVLLKMHRDNSYSNITINESLKKTPLDGADKSLFTALVYGVTERMVTLDYNLSLYLKQPLKKLKPEVLIALRMGAYQILFMDKIPAHAAINESVNLVKKSGAAFASGLTNAVLHKVEAAGLKIPDDSSDFDKKLKHLSVKYSCPEHLVKLFIDSYGLENACGIMERSIGAPPLTIRVNTLKTTTDELIETLKTAGIEAVRHSKVENALVLGGAGGIESLEAFGAGLFHVQDASSQICCERLGVLPGDVVFDMCAAPGGKSFTLAENMKNKGKILAFDLYEHRTNLIKSGADRLGIEIIDAKVGNAEEFNESLGMADKILCDVPCSGLGIIGRKPEIRYKTAENIDNLPALQYHILSNSSGYLKKGGRLVYSTCSLNPKENEEVCKKFIEMNKDFRLHSMETLLPQENDSDGFFIAVIDRTE